MKKISRKKKKMLKKKGNYIPRSDLWAVGETIAEYAYPRLVEFKKVTDSYPGRDEMDTFEKWMEAIDKMILAFKYVAECDSWEDDPKYNFARHIAFTEIDGSLRHTISAEGEKIKQAYLDEAKRRRAVIDEGLGLFAKWCLDLWW